MKKHYKLMALLTITMAISLLMTLTGCDTNEDKSGLEPSSTKSSEISPEPKNPATQEPTPVPTLSPEALAVQAKLQKEADVQELMDNENYIDALKLYAELLSDDPDNIDYLKNQVKALHMVNNYTQLIVAAEKLAAADTDTDYTTQLFLYYEEAGVFEKAALLIPDVSAVNPDNADIMHLCGHVLLAEGEQEKALQYYQSAAALAPDNADYSVDYMVLLYENNMIAEVITFIRNSPFFATDQRMKNMHDLVVVQPDPPVFSNNGGGFPEGQAVSVNITEPSGKCTIFYTLDGNNPTGSSIKYTGDITVLESSGTKATLKAISVNEYGIASKVTTAVFERQVAFSDPFIGRIIAEHFEVAEGAVGASMLEQVTQLEIWGDEYTVNTSKSAIIKRYSSSGDAFLENGDAVTLKNNISTLSDISRFTNIETLSVNYNTIGQIPDLSGLSKLTTIRFINTGLTDISRLAGASKLDTLHLMRNDISDISALSGMSNMVELNLCTNKIRVIPDLSAMQSLKELEISENRINDISGLAGISSITKMRAAFNDIVDLTPLRDCIYMKTLGLTANKCGDISPLAGMPMLQTLFVNNCGVADISALASMSEMTMLQLSGNMISDISVLTKLTSLKSLYFTGNGASYDTSILDQLTWVETKNVD